MMKVASGLMLKFNFIKIEDWEGNWHTYRHQCNINKKIKNAKNIYISVNKFLNYRERSTYSYQNKPFQTYELIDIDGQNFSSPQESKDYFIQIVKFLKDNHIRTEEMVCTNDSIGGYQILIPPDCRSELSRLIKTTPNVFNKIDFRVLNDLKRVRRAPATFNGNRGTYSYLCDKHGNKTKDLNMSKLFEISSLGMPLENSLQPLEPVLTGKPAKVVKLSKNEANDNQVVQATLTPQQNKGQVTANKSKLPAFLVKEMSNSVIGKKGLYVPVLKFRDKPSGKRILKLITTYNLGDLYLFRYFGGFYAISPKISQYRRLEKIYKKAKCWSSLSELQKFRQNFIYISNTYDLERFIKGNDFEFIEFFANDVGGWFSFTHLLFLNKFIKKEYTNQIGEKPKVYTALFTTQ